MPPHALWLMMVTSTSRRLSSTAARGKTTPKKSAAETAETDRLKAENRELHDKLDTMQDRMIVLEKIVTDRGYTLSEEIEALRDTPSRSGSTNDAGVPLNLDKKETSA